MVPVFLLVVLLSVGVHAFDRLSQVSHVQADVARHVFGTVPADGLEPVLDGRDIAGQLGGLVPEMSRSMCARTQGLPTGRVGRLIILDELGYVPIDEGAAASCSRSWPTRTRGEAEHRLHHQHRVQRMGRDLRRSQHGRRDHRSHHPPRRQLLQDPRPRAIANN